MSDQEPDAARVETTLAASSPLGEAAVDAPARAGGLRWVVPVLVAIIAALLIVIVVREPSQPQATAQPTATVTAQAAQAADNPAPPPQVDLTEVEGRDLGDPLGIGAVDAPVVLIVFSDFQCGFCARWSDQTLPTMLEYVDSGQLRIEWRDINIFGADSERAARAVYAAALQGAFLEYHEELFPGGETRSPDQLTDAALIASAADLGLDTERFAADLASEETAAQIAANAQLGIGLGATSTPSFLLGGVPLVGAQPTEVFVEALEQALAAA